jgi:inorganic pyrophosphatase
LLLPADQSILVLYNIKGGGGDLLDVIVTCEVNSFTSCVMDCRIIGCITAEQTEEGKTFRNDRFIAIPQASQMFATIKELKALPKKMLETW